MARISLKPPRSAAQHWRARGTSTSCCWRDSEDGRSASLGRGRGAARAAAAALLGLVAARFVLGLLALTLHTHIMQKLRQHRPQVCVIVINTISTIVSMVPSFRGCRVSLLFILLQTMAAAEAPPRLQTAGGPSFGEGSFQPGDMVTIHNVTNLDDGLSAKVIAFDPDKNLYVVKDSMASIWGLRAEKLRPQKVLEMPEGVEWHDVPDGTVVPKGLRSKDLSTGRSVQGVRCRHG